jgi:hypothetical protein
LRILLGALLAVFALSFDNVTPKIVAETANQYPPVSCAPELCIIKASPGGIVDHFEAQGRQLLADGTPIIVDGPCESACTILIDIARENVCITSKAMLAYHQSYIPGTEKSWDIEYVTPGLNDYLNSRGGQPGPGTGTMLTLNFNEAKQFYKPCRI